jgi:membrane protease subunit HflK
MQRLSEFKEDLKLSLSNLSVVIKRVSILIIALYFLSGIYAIDTNETGIITRFGKITQKAIPPGLHYHLPWPVEEAHKVKIKEAKRMEAGFWIKEGGLEKLRAAYGAGANKRIGLEIPYCITGDKNIIHIKIVIQYVIKDAVSFLYEVKDPIGLMDEVAKNKIIVCVSKVPVDDFFTAKKHIIIGQVRDFIQNEIDRFKAGIQVISIELKLLEPIPPAQGAFKEVISAQEEKLTLIHEAESYRNSIIPSGLAEAENKRNEALAYKYKRISFAQGEVERFFKIWQEYKSNKRGISSRLYLESMREILPALKKFIVEPGQEKVYLKILK